MFRIISNLLFGEEEKPIEVVTSLEEEDEEWHVVSHQDAVADEHQKVALLDQPNSAIQPNSSILQDAGASQDQNKKSTDQASPGVHYLPESVAHGTQSACVQKAKAWADRQSFSWKSVQRQNRIQLGVQHQAFHLHQPGHRNLCH